MTEAQLNSLKHIHAWHSVQQPLEQFIKTAQPQIGFNDGSIMVQAGSMWIGIEADGSRHT